MAPVRRLTAMLAADVSGYSRLMGADEEGTHERLKAHLLELVNPTIDERRGRIVKNTGDGFLAEFVSVVDAVRCAVEIQRGMTDREAQRSEPQQIRFRIGVNLGDVIVEEHDIFGDGVNVAARLEALAEPGGICVSQVTRDQVRDKLDFAFEDLGEQRVKNITRPIRVYRVRDPAIEAREPLRRPHGPSPSQDQTSGREETFSFGVFRLVPAQRALLEEGKPLRLGSRAFDILVALIERPGETISKEELIARAWPDTIVEEAALRVHVAALRRRSAMAGPASATSPTTPGEVTPLSHR
jgi:class 3 adenylate cyclase